MFNFPHHSLHIPYRTTPFKGSKAVLPSEHQLTNYILSAIIIVVAFYWVEALKGSPGVPT